MERLFVILFTFGPAFVILSLSYEALFFATLCVALLSWMKLEIAVARRSKDHHVGLTSDHLRIALFFLAFVHVCFFGVGNVASISSVSLLDSMRPRRALLTLLVAQFYLEPVYRLIPVFAPFPMVSGSASSMEAMWSVT